MKKIIILAFLALATTFAQASENTPRLLILQANTHGNDNGGAGGFAASLVELFNNTGAAIDLDAGNYFLHIGNATQWTNAIRLRGVIPAQSSFLIVSENPQNPTPRAVLPTPDQMAEFTLVNDGFKVAVLREIASLSVNNPFMDASLAPYYVDMLGVSGSSGFETQAAQQSRPQGPRRTSLLDTDNNYADFSQADFRGELLGNNRIPDNQLYRIWPRNSSTPWNPITGLPAIHPVPYPHLAGTPNDPNADPVLAGTQDILAGKLLILQAYGSATEANGTTHSFVELYNNSDEWIDLAGISLFFANGIRGLVAREAGVDTQWQRIPLSGTMPPRTSFLILGYRQNLNAPDGVGSGSAPRFAIHENSADLFAPNFSLSNRAFKIALIRSDGRLTMQNPFTMDGDIGEIADGYIDMLGSANDINHATNPDNIFGFETAPARHSGSQSARRENLNDTDNNSVDFITIDFRSSGTTDEELEIFRPKNRGFGPWNPLTGEQYTPSGDPTITTTITSFRFSYQSIGWGESGYWEGVINQDEKTITFTTQRWIGNIHQLPAIFELDDDAVAKVGGEMQWSGITANDFRRNVIYTIGANQYTVRFVSPQATGLPVISINTYGETIHHSSTGIWTTMTFSLSDPNNPEHDIATITNQQIRGRGNTTWWWYPKRPFRVRFRDDVSVFGLAARRNWILLAEFRDPTFLTTATAFRLGREVFEMPYAPSYQHVQLYLNGKFQGLYLLTEHRQADPRGEGVPGRPQICPNAGWFVEINNAGEAPFFRVDLPAYPSGNLPVRIMSPEYSGNIADERYRFVIDDWNELVGLINCSTFPESGYRNLINIDAFVDYLLVSWITGDYDFRFPSNVYVFRDASGTISVGPIWDFDAGFGFDWEVGSFGVATPSYPKPVIFYQLFRDPVFLVRLKERWNEKHDEIVALPEFMHPLGEALSSAIKQDYKRHSDSRYYRENFDLTTEINRIIAWWHTHVLKINNMINAVEVVAHNFEIADLTPQTFTLVAYGEMLDLEAFLQNADTSAFEIVTGLTQTPTGNGGYLATISIGPKGQFSPGIFRDTLILSGTNQGNPFSFSIPLEFATHNEETLDYIAALRDEKSQLYDSITALHSNAQYLYDSITTLHDSLETKSIAKKELLANATHLNDSIATLLDSISNLYQRLTICEDVLAETRLTASLQQDTIYDLQQIIVEWIEITYDLLDTIDWLRELLMACENNATNVVETGRPPSLQVFPNPVTDKLHIAHDWQSGDVVELFDMNGRRVFIQPVETGHAPSLHNGTFVIDMSQFPAGNYILRIGHRLAKILRR